MSKQSLFAILLALTAGSVVVRVAPGSCATVCADEATGQRLASGKYSLTQSWSQETEFERRYLVRVPKLAEQAPLPVLLFLHGNGGNAEGAMQHLARRLKTIASEYVIVVPNGYAKSWNIVSERSQADDLAFVEAIVKQVTAFENVQPDNVTIMGTSNGAALVNQLAIESRLPQIRNYISAVSPLNVYQHDGQHFRQRGADNNYQAVAPSPRRARLLNISGTEDRLVPYAGGPSRVIPAKDGKLAFVGAERSTFLWAQQFGYQDTQLTEPSGIDGKLEFYSYLDGDVVHIKVNGAGHGATGEVPESVLLEFIAGASQQRAEAAPSNADRQDRIQPAASLPSTMPWDLAKLSTTPQFAWGPISEVRSLHYSGEPYAGKPTRVFAYYASPTTLAGNESKDKPANGRYPAVVLIHGGGGTAFPQWAKLWAERGYAAIAMDLAGCGANKQRLPDGGPGQGHDMKFGTIREPVTEQWTYHAVANVIRAHSLVRSFPEVDSSRTALTGISWGGYLTCIVAGLDDRFQAAVPVYGCGFLHENSVWLGDFEKMTAQEKSKWIRLWDPSQYAGSAAMPMLFVNGGKDFAYPPDSHAKTFGLVKTRKYLHFVPDLAHGHIFDRPSAIEHFFAAELDGAAPLVRVSQPKVEQGQAIATIVGDREAVEATLHFTTDKLSGKTDARVWRSEPATISGTSVSSAAPTLQATAWFFTVKDKRNIVTSSPLVVSTAL